MNSESDRSSTTARALKASASACPSPIRALAPDQFPLHHRNRQPGRVGPIGDVLANGARPEDDDVIDILRQAAAVLFRS